MSRNGRRLVEDFLLPALDKQKYGERLCWVNRDAGYFSIRWSHKNAAKWTLEDTVVFQDWDRLKGHFHPEVKGYYMQAKQRFRAALYKLSTVKKVCSKEKHTKIYQLVQGDEKKRLSDPQVVPYPKHCKDVLCIPTPVICRNEHYVPSKQVTDERTDQPVSFKSENSEHFTCTSSSDSSGFSNDEASDMAAENSFPHLLENHDCDEKVIKPPETSPAEIPVVPQQRHVPVQRLPEYIPSKPRSISRPSVFRNEKELSIMKKEPEPMDVCSQALNLCVKHDSYQNPGIPISAR